MVSATQFNILWIYGFMHILENALEEDRFEPNSDVRTNEVDVGP
jgi:hypothetical protein